MSDIREIKRIIVHHTAGGRYETFEGIRRDHMEALGWRDIGYHYVIDHDGDKRFGRSVDEIGAHVRGFNKSSIGIAVMGNFEEHPFTWYHDQAMALDKALTDLAYQFPDAVIIGHKEIAATLCPGRHVMKWLAQRR